ncbi:MAG: 2-succinyl-5-enolpyruvyl-6-hydroxy-3-cyclohexene-1-carboxylic-acid synthase [Bacteroidota bacterium]|nr:2-succinyl-5-enolpyruvyl-6-hydroxy-3-cyclohexene-1-carboxylic-acid synthase [Bacteroidota bacterium]
MRHAVLCPGSRSAPLALSFMRHGGITCFVIPDERSAAYTALGISQSKQKPVALISTSGTAALNFAPAVAEAYFSNVPLIVFTADRPAEWIGQADNQAVYQQNIYGRHVCYYALWPVDLDNEDSAWFALRALNDALNIAQEGIAGPVHINVPLREPLYLDNPVEKTSYDFPFFERQVVEERLPQNILDDLSRFKRIMVVAGTFPPQHALMNALDELNPRFIFLPDVTSNLHRSPQALEMSDLLPESITEHEAPHFAPDLLITFGGAVVSKSLRQYLRNCRELQHWHLSYDTEAVDTFRKLTKCIPVLPVTFFRDWAAMNYSGDDNFINSWYTRNNLLKRAAMEVLNDLPFSEPAAANSILRSIKKGVLHLGNSLPVRYVAAFPFLGENVAIYSNRGTSGIDGSVSAAAGHSMTSDLLNVLILGDLSFFYDRNGLWNNYLKSNFKIIVFNNHGGGIFRQLPGSASQPELEEYFAIRQPLNVRHTALQHNCSYIFCNSSETLVKSIEELLSDDNAPGILELDFSGNTTIAEVKKLVLERAGLGST